MYALSLFVLGTLGLVVSFVDAPPRFCSLKSATFALHTAHSISFSPTMFKALVRQAEQSGWEHGSSKARVPFVSPHTEHESIVSVSRTVIGLISSYCSGMLLKKNVSDISP